MARNTYLSLAVLFGWFLIMYLANAWMPLYRDDYLAAVIWRTGDHLQDMGDVLYSLERYYEIHGGRLVSFFIQFTFMLWGKFYFNIANALVFALLLPVMLMHCRRDFGWNKEPLALILLGAFAWLGISHFGEIAIWLCGSCVYLWTGLFTGIFLLPYNAALAGNFRSSSALLAFFMLPLGAVAACSVENLTVTTTLLALGISWVAYRRRIMAPWMITGAVGSAVGSLVCIFAPGNFVRIIVDEDAGMIFHVLNQIPSNLEMVMYMFPLLLTLVLAHRILRLQAAKRQGISLPPAESAPNRHYVMWGFLLVTLLSFCTTGFFAKALENLIVGGLLIPLGFGDSNTLDHFANTMAGFEEALIYILGVSLIYLLSVNRLALHKARIKTLPRIGFRDLLAKFPQLQYGLFLMGLAFVNNSMVMGAPSFPGRALFSSSIMFIIGAVAILRIDAVWAALIQSPGGRIWRRGGVLLTGFIIVATLTVLHSIWQEDAIRVAYIAKEAAAGKVVVTVPPSAIPEQLRILRHIAYDDFDTGMTREHICYYFGIGSVELDPNMSLEDISQ
ncbi:MAG: hypothetical protein IJ849_01420 [Selenomonadaceae bacterium]|nr:hypothetical protein [Selenomonadaceae bacterium]